MPANNLARIEPQQMTWNDEDKKLIKETVAKNTTDAEFKLFLKVAGKYNLDPFVKQIWCVKYGDKPAAIYTSRDGFLSIAHRSGLFDGMETTSIRENGKLIGARCAVYRKGYSHPFVVEVALSEYNTGQNQWAKMPETMIKKVAESQALRRAFDISGMYEPGEIDTTETIEGRLVDEPTPLHPEGNQLSPELSRRFEIGNIIAEDTGMETVEDDGDWIKIDAKACEKTLKLIGPFSTIEEFAKAKGVEKLGPLVKEQYPDANVSGKMYSAILHMAYEWRENEKAVVANRKSERNQETVNKANAVFEDAEVRPLEPEDEEF